MKKPKIIATLGTTTDSKIVLEQMIVEGMRCARMNTAYATIDEYQARLDMLRDIAPVDVMMDIKGPQVRLEADRAYQIEEEDMIIVGFKNEPIHFNKNFYDDVDAGDEVLIENGTIKTHIAKKKEGKLHLMIDEPGEGQIHKQMGINVPGIYLNVSKLSSKDKEVIDFTLKNNIEYIMM